MAQRLIKLVRPPSWSDLEQAIKNGKPLNVITRLLDSGAPTTMWSPSPEGSALVTAAIEGRDDIVSLLLDRGANINIISNTYGTALAAAALHSEESMVQLLLDRGANVDMVGGKCVTALGAAVFQGSNRIISLLLDRGADINAARGTYGTLLNTAVFKASCYTVELLLDEGVDINAVGGKYGTALATAVYRGTRDSVQLLLKQGANVNMVGGEYGTALATAAFKGYPIIADWLLERGADINAVGSEYGTALAVAAIQGKEQLVSLLLDRGADINVVGGRYGTALAAAAFQERTEIVKLLLDRGADINAVGGEYGTALAAAAFGGFPSITQLLLDRGADINVVGGKYGTPLAVAALKGDIPGIVGLLERGADINAVGGEYGTALALATLGDQRDIISLLLDRGANINAVSGKYGTALATAVFGRFASTVELLLDREANINVVGGKYGTALATAAHKGFEEIIELLLDRGADINIMQTKNITALAAAARRGRMKSMSLLLDRGADINAVLGESGTALGAAALRGDNPTLQLLLDRGAYINIVGDQYGTALAAAAYEGKMDTVLLLLDRGADINAVGGVYGTALGAAAFRGWKYIVEELLDRGADINAVGGKYGTALGAAAFKAFRAMITLLLNRGADINAVGGEYGTVLATTVAAGRIPYVSLLLDKGADITQIRGWSLTAIGVGNAKISQPPFPMPYHHSDTISPSLSSLYILSTEFCAGGSISPEQANIRCSGLSVEVLSNSLSTLVGLDKKTRSQARHQWIRNDSSYFGAHHFDFGLAYAASRVAWKDFREHSIDSGTILVQRSRWRQHVQVLEEARLKVIEIEIDGSKTSQELIVSPYSIMPRRLWDLKSNRVIDFQILHATQFDIKTPPIFWAVSHSWTDDMSPVWTAVNQYQWPVPLPRNITLEYLRSELLTLGAEYVWLDVVCLRQKVEVNSLKQPRQQEKLDVDSLEQLRQQEWKLDVPTIGNIYRAAAKIVRYFNGIGVPFCSTGWDDPRHWLQRAWTLQEIADEKTTINGGIPQDATYREQAFLNSKGKVSDKVIKFRSAIRPVIQLAAEVDSPGGCEIYELAREMAKRHASQPLDKLSGLFYLLRTTKLPCYNDKLTSEDIWRQCFHLLPIERKAEVLFDFPYRGSDTEWFPTWTQVLDWPTRDPEYDHMRSRISRDLMGGIPGEMSLFMGKIWTIPDVILCETVYPGEYKAEISKRVFNFYLPYLSQKPLPIKDQRVFTLATMDIGHAHNWVVCEAIGNRIGSDIGFVGVVKVNVLKKVGVMRTDTCSELSVGGENGASLLQKMDCLFV